MPQQLNPTPTNTSMAVSGGGGNTTTSGTTPRGGWTGASGTFSGPHFIEDTGAPATTELSGSVAYSYLNVKVAATVNRHKSYDLYGTSSFQQAQRFEVMSTSADAQGFTYGAVPTGALGPAGSIATTQKFYTRRPWLSTDASCSYTSEGYNYAFEPSALGTLGEAGCKMIPNYGGAGGLGGDIQTHALGLTYMTELVDRWELRPTNHHHWEELSTYQWSVPGRLMGPYQASNDQAYFVPQVIDWCGSRIRNGWLYNGEIARLDEGTAANHYWPSQSIAKGALISFDASAGGAIHEYDVSRHDYS